jgi:plastocyanin
MSRRCALAIAIATFVGAIGFAGQSFARGPGARVAIPGKSRRPGAIKVGLGAMPHGTATLTREGAAVKVSFAMWGLTPGSAHTVDLTSGVCPGQVSGTEGRRLGVIRTNSEGELHTSLLTAVPIGSGILAPNVLVVRLGTPAEAATDTTAPVSDPVACATLPGRFAQQRTLRLHSVSPSGARLSGAAHLTYDATAQTLAVQISARGFVPGTSHAAHIHAGSCEHQGAVIYALPDLVADAQGDISSTTTLTGVTSPPPVAGWYLNLHLGNSSNILNAAGSPTLAFRPLLCGNIQGSPPPITGSAAPGTASFTAVDMGSSHFWYVTGTTSTQATIAQGGTVTFSYPSGSSRHNVDFGSGPQPSSCTQTAGPNSGAVPPLPHVPTAPGWSGSCTFNNAGTYIFICDLHPNMISTIIVQAPEATTSTSRTRRA